LMSFGRLSPGRGISIGNSGSEENGVQRQYRQGLSGFVCLIVAFGAGCSTTNQAFRPSQAAMSGHGIDVGDTVLIRFASRESVQISSSSEQVRISEINQNDLVGFSDSGETINVRYSDIYRIEYRKVRLNRHDPPFTAVERQKTGEFISWVFKALGSLGY
jgi:hypothetical protein